MYLLKDRHGIPRHGDWVERLVFKDSVENLVFIIAAEGGLPEKHLIHQYAERPPINRTTVTLLKENLANRQVELMFMPNVRQLPQEP